MTNSELQIEELRRRAKDNKAKNAEYYLTLSFNTIKELQTVLFTLPSVAFAYVQSSIGKVSNPHLFKTYFMLSIIFGILGYFLSWIGHLKQSGHYSDREKILSMGFPTEKEYVSMINKEYKIVENFKNYWFSFGFFSILIQAIFTILTLLLL